MGESQSANQLAGKLALAAASLSKVDKQALNAGSLIVKTTVLGGVASAIGGDMAMGKKRVNVRYKVAGDVSTIRPSGPMHWLEKGVKPHAVVTKGAGGSRAKRSALVAGGGALSFGKPKRGARGLGALRFSNGNFRPYARAAGSFKAQRTWSKGATKSVPLVSKAWQKIHRANLAAQFK